MTHSHTTNSTVSGNPGVLACSEAPAGSGDSDGSRTLRVTAASVASVIAAIPEAFGGSAALVACLVMAAVFAVCSCSCCQQDKHSSNLPANSADSLPSAGIHGHTTPVYTYRVVNTYPHARDAFTQGLVFDDGLLYEGTGNYGSSTLRKVELETGRILQTRELPPKYFGEGITIYEDKIIQLTWQSHLGFVYDKPSFRLLRDFRYPTEGWGITHDKSRLIMSDGTSILHFLDPETFEETGRIQVKDGSRPVGGLNELEYVRGEIYANVWPTDRVARISPQTGRVVGWIELGGLLTREDLTRPVDVLNGIAYDSKRGRLFVTGKWWPRLFEIEIVSRSRLSE